MRWIQPGEPIPADTDVVILPGSKATRTDLDVLRREGWDIDILAHVRRGGRVVGLCAGFQMLGRVVRDPHGPRRPAGRDARGSACSTSRPRSARTSAWSTSTSPTGVRGCRVTGYEMHMGRTTGRAWRGPG